MEEHPKLDYFGPEIVIAIVIAFFGDLFMIPTLLVSHFVAGLAVCAVLLPRLKHKGPKAILILSVILPAPFLLAIGIIVAALAQNKLIEGLIAQTAIIAAGAISGGSGAVVGEALEGAGAAAEGAAVATEAGEAAGAAGGVAAEGVAEAGAEGAAEGGARGASSDLRPSQSKPEGPASEQGEAPPENERGEGVVSDEALGEEKPVFDQIKDMVDKLPDSEEEEEADDEDDEEHGVRVNQDTNTVDLSGAAQ
jgi:hypothetical protein